MYFSSGDSHVQSQTPAQIYCGRRLAYTIAILCDSVPTAKRDYNSIDNDQNNLPWPWMTPHNARTMGRGKRMDGIVQECCDKPCTQEEMVTYCPKIQIALT